MLLTGWVMLHDYQLRSYLVNSRAIAVSINPLHPLPLFGFAGRYDSFGSVATGLEANVIAFSGSRGRLVFIVGIDSLFSSDALKAAVLNEFGESARAQIQEVIFVASHTHGAPALDPTKPLLGVVDPAYFGEAACRIADAMRSLFDRKLGPTGLQLGLGRCSLNAIRRRIGIQVSVRAPFFRVGCHMLPRQSDAVPRGIQVIVSRSSDGTPAWIIWQWNCHPTASPTDVTRLDADFPGVIRQNLRNHFQLPDLPVVFMPGCSGDIMQDSAWFPVSPKTLLTYPLQRTFSTPTNRSYAKFCRVLSTAILQALQSLSPLGSSSEVRSARVALPLSEIYQTSEAGAMDLCRLECGALSLLLIGAEVCSPFISKLAPFLPANTLISGYADQVHGYLPDDLQVLQGGYEVDGFRRFFGRTGPLRTNIDERVVVAIRELGRELSDDIALVP